MRALFATYEKQIKTGKYIFVVKNTIHEKNVSQLKKDFNFAFKRLELLK
jgi:ribonuclease P protein component